MVIILFDELLYKLFFWWTIKLINFLAYNSNNSHKCHNKSWDKPAHQSGVRWLTLSELPFPFITCHGTTPLPTSWQTTSCIHHQHSACGRQVRLETSCAGGAVSPILSLWYPSIWGYHSELVMKYASFWVWACAQNGALK